MLKVGFSKLRAELLKAPLAETVPHGVLLEAPILGFLVSPKCHVRNKVWIEHLFLLSNKLSILG